MFIIFYNMYKKINSLVNVNTTKFFFIKIFKITIIKYKFKLK